MANRDIKSELMEHTIRLVDQAGGDVERVTIRDIAAAAGVGVGLVNYLSAPRRNCCTAVPGRWYRGRINS